MLNLVEYLIQTFGQDKTSYPLVPVSSKLSQPQPARPPPPPTSQSHQPHQPGFGPPRPPPPGQYDSARQSGELHRPPPVPGVSNWLPHQGSDSTGQTIGYGSFSTQPTPPPQPPLSPVQTGGPPIPPSANGYHNSTYQPIPPGAHQLARPSSVSPQPGSSFPPDTPAGYGPPQPPPVPRTQSPAFTGAGYVPSTAPVGYSPGQSPHVQSALPPHLQPPRPPASPPRGPQPPPVPRSAYAESVAPQHTGSVDGYQVGHGRQSSYDQTVGYGSYPGTPLGSAHAGPPQPPPLRPAPPSGAYSAITHLPQSVPQQGYYNQPPAGYGPPQPGPPRAQTAPIQTRKARVNILDDEDGYSSISATPVSAYGTPVPSSADSPRQTASAAPPPPRPPHPELVAIRARLHAKLTASLQNLGAETEVQRVQLDVLEGDLLKGEPAILDEMQRLQAVRGVCENVKGRYEAVVREAEGRMREYEQRGDGPEVDEIVCSSTVVYNQLVDLVAEDGALEDTIYQLGRGLNSDTADIDLERFLKVRWHEGWGLRLVADVSADGLVCLDSRSVCGGWRGSSSSSGP